MQNPSYYSKRLKLRFDDEESFPSSIKRSAPQPGIVPRSHYTNKSGSRFIGLRWGSVMHVSRIKARLLARNATVRSGKALKSHCKLACKLAGRLVRRLLSWIASRSRQQNVVPFVDSTHTDAHRNRCTTPHAQLTGTGLRLFKHPLRKEACLN